MIRLVITGGRDLRDRDLVDRTLDEVRSNQALACLIHGGCRGADTLAKEWAERYSILTIEFKPAWLKLGKAAGPIRNTQMLVEGRPDLVVAFPGGRGTADLVAKAKKRGIPILEAKP